MAPDPNNGGGDIEEIDPDGDLVLIVGKDAVTADRIKKFRVSSVTLMKTSAVFNAMLGPNFREGQMSGSVQSKREIELPDDNPGAMGYMCKLLHLKGPLPLDSSKNILKLGVIVDKYGCADTIRLQSNGILLLYLDDKRCDKLKYEWARNVTAAAYLLDNPSAFRFATRSLIVDHKIEVLSKLLSSTFGTTLGAENIRK